MEVNTSLTGQDLRRTGTGQSFQGMHTIRTVTGSVVPNLITSGKSVTTLEAPKNPVVKPVTKVEQNIETVKQPAVTSEKPKTVERSHSQGSNNHNSNKESFNQKTEKNPNINPAGENYGTEKTLNKMLPFSNRENIHRNSNTPNYDYKVQDNSGSNGSSNGDSGSKKNIEPSVENSGKIYALESQDANWNFKSEIPKMAVKNSEGNYTLGKNNEWNFDTKYNIPYTETGNKGQGLVSVPSYNAVTNDYSRNYDVFYRSISETHYNRLMETGDIPPKKETSITQNFSYSSGYQEKHGGMTVEIKTKPGTLRVLEQIGVKNNSASIIDDLYSNMKQTFPGWEKMGRVQFKEEKSQITINLGKGSGLEIFNKRIKQINVKQGDIQHEKNK